MTKSLAIVSALGLLMFTQSVSAATPATQPASSATATATVTPIPERPEDKLTFYIKLYQPEILPGAPLIGVASIYNGIQAPVCEALSTRWQSEVKYQYRLASATEWKEFINDYGQFRMNVSYGFALYPGFVCDVPIAADTFDPNGKPLLLAGKKYVIRAVLDFDTVQLTSNELPLTIKAMTPEDKSPLAVLAGAPKADFSSRQILNLIPNRNGTMRGDYITQMRNFTTRFPDSPYSIYTRASLVYLIRHMDEIKRHKGTHYVNGKPVEPTAAEIAAAKANEAAAKEYTEYLQKNAPWALIEIKPSYCHWIFD